MRIVKYLTLTILLAAVLILAETNQLLYTVNFAFGSLRAYYELQVTQKDLPVLAELGTQYDMTLCLVENRMTTTQEFDVYATADEAELCGNLHMHFGSFRSIFYHGTIQIRAHKFTDFTVPENNVRVYIIGDNQADFERALESKFPVIGGMTMQQDPSSMLIVGWLAWGVLIVFAFFLSAFDAESKRRTSFVRIINGALPAGIVLANIGIELAVISGIIALVSGITNCFVTVEINTQFGMMAALLLLASTLPYLVLCGMNYKVITHERLTVSRLLNFGYIYKTLLLCMTMGVFSLTASVGTDFFQYLKVLRYAKAYQDYSFVKIGTSEVSMLGDIDIDDFLKYQQLTNQRIEEIYRKYYDSNHALIIEPYGQYLEEGGLICCNANATDYIDRLFPEHRGDMTDADVCLFLPEDCSNESYFLDSAELVLWQYVGENWHPGIKVIRYHGRKTGFYFAPYEDALMETVSNPAVLYCTRTPAQIGADVTDSMKMSVGGLAFRVDDTMLRELEARNDILFEITPIASTLRTNMAETMRICGALALICAVFIALNLFVSGFLIRMEYRLRAKEYCIKTVLGYTMLQKFGSFLTMSLLSVLISAIVVIVLRNQLRVNPAVLCAICGGMLLVDTVSVLLYAVRTERSSIVQCLKGGAL